MHTFHQIWIHLVWSTKYRNPLLNKPIRKRVFQFMRHKANEHEYTIDLINGVEDHVHCLICLKPTEALSDVVKNIKGSSSRWVNEMQLTDEHFTWQVGYGAISVSPRNVQQVRNYILKQEENHQKKGFEEEMKEFKAAFYYDA
ncbi:MAG: IS200/IS605 family transposase [Chitinophagales bacterium]